MSCWDFLSHSAAKSLEAAGCREEPSGPDGAFVLTFGVDIGVAGGLRRRWIGNMDGVLQGSRKAREEDRCREAPYLASTNAEKAAVV